MIKGDSHPDFARTRAEFERNFTERDEVGASLAVYLGDECVVDLWGGLADPETGSLWRRDTVGVVYSCTKGAVALCIHLLIDRGQLQLDAPIADYWPEFAARGKGSVTVGMVLAHTAGIPAVRAPMAGAALEDWDRMTATIADEEPSWPAGTDRGYHALTFGYILGELVRRVDGRTIGTFFAEEVADPTGIDFWIGLPAEIEPRVAQISRQAERTAVQTPFVKSVQQTGSIPNLFIRNSGTWSRTGVHTRAGRAAEIPAANGVSNARGLAALYQVVGQHVDPLRLAEASSTGFDRTLLQETAFAGGFMTSIAHSTELGDGHGFPIPKSAFGHCGNGGSFGFIDPTTHVSVGYTMNRIGPGPLINRRGSALIDAICRDLGS